MYSVLLISAMLKNLRNIVSSTVVGFVLMVPVSIPFLAHPICSKWRPGDEAFYSSIFTCFFHILF